VNDAKNAFRAGLVIVAGIACAIFFFASSSKSTLDASNSVGYFAYLTDASGINAKSLITVAGLQVEIDPTKRAWSGGIYDERGRAWLANLEGDDAARAAFRLGEWNRYEIRAEGNRIRLILNGVTTVDYTEADPTIEQEGLIGLQIHGKCKAEVAFRNISIEELPKELPAN
jgi:hypothetical protein